MALNIRLSYKQSVRYIDHNSIAIILIIMIEQITSIY